ncbi:DUF7550 family protein [Haloterrigena alkaliphila]|uniref:Uncharacterized protein n=1 Tax=Haloterrigena alkaliphila TaxID=2816475 RepID=A0A8A2VEM9_9EURY|nr:hypothetical protein [Haloterrigena alkaliphila]QSW98812.1 hypothetical protein J0X25_15680 [Haloterrigena alkaliphila]
MTDDTDQTAEEDTGADVGHDLEAERTTAPMSDYGGREVGIGLLVMVIGSAVAFGVPLLTVGF